MVQRDGFPRRAGLAWWGQSSELSIGRNACQLRHIIVYYTLCAEGVGDLTPNQEGPTGTISTL